MVWGSEALNGEVEGPRAVTESPPRVHNLLWQPRRY